MGQILVWYHRGSSSLTAFTGFTANMWTLYSFANFSITLRSSRSVEFLTHVSHVWRIGMTCDSWSSSTLSDGWMSIPMILSAKYVQVALSSPRLSQALSHIRCISLFLALMSRIFLPPCWCGAYICAWFTAYAFSWFQVKWWICLFILLSTTAGIPWTLVRYCMTPVNCIWRINLHPSSECPTAPHRCSCQCVIF